MCQSKTKPNRDPSPRSRSLSSSTESYNTVLSPNNNGIIGATAIINNLHTKNQQISSLLLSQTPTLGQMHHSISQYSNCQILTTGPSTNQPSQLLPLFQQQHQHQQQQQQQSSSSLLFSSPYVNKYDTSVKNLLNSNELSNLYSVPNRRTSVALNSLDDTAILMNQSRSSSSTTTTASNIPSIKANNFSIITSTVTSSTNSLTYSKITYHMENNSTATTTTNTTDDFIESSVDSIGGLSINNETNKKIRQRYRSIDEENLANYRSFLLSRHNSSGSNRSSSSSSTSSSSTTATKTSKSSSSSSSTKSSSIKQMANNNFDDNHRINHRLLIPESESNYVNLESKMMPLSTSGGQYLNIINNNSDYVNLIMPRNSLSSSSSSAAAANIQSQNHIYQNSQNLLSSIKQVTTSISPPMRRSQPPKTWYETDLDFHHHQMKFSKPQQQQQQSL